MEATERLVNLAMFLVSTREPVTAEECRAEVAGYPADQSDDSFLRMFERDKEELRAAGLAIRVTDGGGVEAYRVDHDATHVRPADFTPEEEATLGVAAAALASDPAFPFAEDLRLALAKALPEVDAACALPVAGSLADEDPATQGGFASTLAHAAAARKRVVFGYTNARGEQSSRGVEPLGLFLREGRWYLVGRDASRGDVRTFAVARMQDLHVNEARPKSPDFEVPERFDVSSFVLLPFQYGEGAEAEAVVRLAPEAAFRVDVLTGGVGEVEGDTWRVPYRNADALLRWLVANGPGLSPVSPPELVARLRERLEGVAAAHGA